MSGSNLDKYLIDENLKEKYMINDDDWNIFISWLNELNENDRNSFNYHKFYQSTDIAYYKAVNLFDLANETHKIFRSFSVRCPVCGEEVALVENPQKLAKKTLYCSKGHNIITTEHPDYLIKSFSIDKKLYYQMDRPKVANKVS